jgi:hypothetical protein
MFPGDELHGQIWLTLPPYLHPKFPQQPVLHTQGHHKSECYRKLNQLLHACEALTSSQGGNKLKLS